MASATSFNSEINDIGSALSDSINKAGTKAFAANQPMGGFILTGLGAGTSSGHSVRYEQMNSAISAYAQPLDATLTALAALSWASGSPVIVETAADTFALSLTPSLSSITLSQGAAATTPSGSFTNTTDNASVLALVIEGDRATPATSDGVYAEYRLSNASGTQKAVARIIAIASNVTAGAETATMRFSLISAGSLTTVVDMTATKLGPVANDGAALGAAATAWADLFGATGFTFNCGNGNAVMTHVTGGFDMTTGTLRTRIPVSTETTGVLTAASANKKVKMSGDCTVNTSVFTADDFILFENNSASTRQVIQGSSVTLRLSGSATTGTRTIAIRSAALALFDTASDLTLHGGNVT